MVHRNDRLAWAFLRKCAGCGAGWLGGCLTVLSALAVPPTPENYVYVPRAHLVEVKQAEFAPVSAPVPGAGVRAFEDPEWAGSGKEQFDIHWYANPPGIPPGVVVLLEAVQERSATIKSHAVRIDTKSEGHMRCVIEIPADQIRQAGRVQKWRVRLVWRGKLLASQASPDWDG